MTFLEPTDNCSLKIIVSDRGQVWFAEGSRHIVNSGVGVDHFLTDRSYRHIIRAARIRLPAVSDHFELIQLLYELFSREEIVSLEVCSPLVVGGRKPVRCPILAIERLRRVSGPPSCGGWIVVDRNLANLFALSDPSLSRDRAVSIIRDIGFLDTMPFVHESAWSDFAFVIGQIIDPRFFVEYPRIFSFNKLNAFFGLDSKFSAAVSSAAAVKDKLIRQESLVKVWRSAVNFDERDREKRFFVDQLEPMVNEDIAVNKVSRRFMTLLRLTWLQLLYANVGDSLFVPQRFFPEHISSWYNRLRQT